LLLNSTPCLSQHTRVASDTLKSFVLPQILYLESIISDPHFAYAISGQNILVKEASIIYFAELQRSFSSSYHHGKTLTRTDKVEREIPPSLMSTRVNVDLHLAHRQKGMLSYRMYVVDFAGDYSFNNPAEEPASFVFQIPFPAQCAVYDSLTISVKAKRHRFC